MAVRGSVLAVGVVLCLAAPGRHVDAQFSNPLKRVGPQPAAPKRHVVQCQSISDKDLDQLTKFRQAKSAMEMEVRRLEDAAQASQTAVAQAGGNRMMEAMARQAECEQAAMEKDPRFKEISRLGELRNKAQDRGDDAAADKYGQQFEALTDVVEKAAKAACLDQRCLARARKESQFRKQIDEMRAAAANPANAQQKAMLEAQIPAYLGMIETEAIQTCGPMGAGAATTAEQAQTDAAANAASQASNDIQKRAAATAGLSDEDLGRIVDCVCGALGDGSGVALSDESRQVIERRRSELQTALDRSGRCGA